MAIAVAPPPGGAMRLRVRQHGTCGFSLMDGGTMDDRLFEGNEELAERLEMAREAVSMSAEADQLLEALQDDIVEDVIAGEYVGGPDEGIPIEGDAEEGVVEGAVGGTAGVQQGLPPVVRTEPRPIEGRLTTPIVRVPREIEQCTGIVVHGHRLRSFIYTTDVAIIRNTNADAILAVYPFTGHPVITQAIISVARAPVFTGVGGGTTTGQRVFELAMFAEMQGVQGVVLNAPAPVETIEHVAGIIDVPIVATILEWDDVARAKVAAGASIVNVAAGRETANVVRRLREEYPDLPVIATGGRTGASILETIEAGANAISWTPPAAQDLQGSMMDSYRAGELGPGHGDAASGSAAADDMAAKKAKLSSWFAARGM